MNTQKVLFVGGVIVVVVIAVWAVFGRGSDNRAMAPSTDRVQQAGTAKGEGEKMMGDTRNTNELAQQNGASMMSDSETAGRYVEYTQSAFEQAVGKRRILFFYANWCPVCRPADADFVENAAKLPSDVVVFRVNYNDTDTESSEKELANKYGVTYQHTFVQIDSNGAVVTKWNGGKMTELLENIQ